MGARSDEAHESLLAEIRHEQAGALGRVGRELHAALETLRASGDSTQAESDLAAAAAERLWCLMVQREACGLTTHEEVFEHYRIPAEVRCRIGVRRRPGP